MYYVIQITLTLFSKENGAKRDLYFYLLYQVGAYQISHFVQSNFNCRFHHFMRNTFVFSQLLLRFNISKLWELLIQEFEISQNRAVTNFQEIIYELKNYSLVESKFKFRRMLNLCFAGISKIPFTNLSCTEKNHNILIVDYVS